MGAIKEFYHDEICAMERGEDVLLDDAYMQEKWQKHQDELALKTLKEMEHDLEEVENSGVPKHLSKFK